MYSYNATVIRIIDGDTYEFLIDLGFKIGFTSPVRLLGVDTPEVVGTHKAAGLAAKHYVEGLLPVGTKILIKTVKDRQEKYGRYLADVHIGSECLGKLLLASGHATPLKGGTVCQDI